jgi:hypothetical protein
MSGYISISRKIFENPLLSDPAYFRAWIWLISQAAWKPMKIRIASGRTITVIELHRGQLSHSRRFMAKALAWTEQRLRTFLNHLEIEGMINLQTDQGQTVITICKYDEYQKSSATLNPHSNPQPNQQSTGNQPKDKNLKELEEENRGADAPSQPFLEIAPENVVQLRPQYAFEGSVVRLTHQSHDKWRKAYPAIADLNAALQAADDYYSENPPKNGKWFFPVSQWLKRDNDAAIQQRRRAGYGSDWF